MCSLYYVIYENRLGSCTTSGHQMVALNLWRSKENPPFAPFPTVIISTQDINGTATLRQNSPAQR